MTVSACETVINVINQPKSQAWKSSFTHLKEERLESDKSKHSTSIFIFLLHNQQFSPHIFLICGLITEKGE